MATDYWIGTVSETAVGHDARIDSEEAVDLTMDDACIGDGGQETEVASAFNDQIFPNNKVGWAFYMHN